MRRKMYPLLLVLWMVQQAAAQQNEKNITSQAFLWVRYYPKFVLGDHWEFHAEIEERRSLFPDRQQVRLLPRVQLYYLLGDAFTFGTGISYFLQSLPADPEQAVEVVRPEWRPHQEINHKTKAGKLGIAHRYRFEERYFRKMEGNQLTDGYDFNFRARYQLQLQYPLIRKDVKKGALDIKMYDEIMLNLGKQVVYNTFDQNRLGMALNYGILENLQLQFDFFHWFQQRNSGIDYISQYISRFTIFHTMDFSH